MARKKICKKYKLDYETAVYGPQETRRTFSKKRGDNDRRWPDDEDSSDEVHSTANQPSRRDRQ